MSREKTGKAGEILIRVMCFVLGALLMLAAVMIKERVGEMIGKKGEGADNGQMTTELASVSPVEEKKSEEVEVKQEEVFEQEAEVLYEQMVASMEEAKAEAEAQAETEPVEENKDENGYYLIDDKPSFINWNTEYPHLKEENDLEWHAARKTSYDETMTYNAFDKKVIENNTVDFSKVKITILGDSITAATNLSEEDQANYNYPKILGEILGCEVVNMGLGGSVVSRCSSNDPMVERWKDIPEDTDIIIVFGGTNDCLFENKWQFGEIEYEKRMTSETFCGDLDEMVGGIKYVFSEHNDDKYVKLFYINPMCTVLNDAVYATDPGNMVPQETFARAINEIVPPYGFDVIDLYNQNFLNSHDPQINQLYVTDGVHPTIDGYRILAEHIASEIIQRVNP